MEFYIVLKINIQSHECINNCDILSHNYVNNCGIVLQNHRSSKL